MTASGRRRALLAGAAAVAVAAVVAVTALVGGGGGDGGGGGSASTVTAEPARRPVAGFGEVGFRLGPAAGAAWRCALLADTEPQRQRGLMGRRDLAGYDAMVFRFPADTAGSFYMRDVPVPLDIAWFDAAGRLVSTATMAPCPDVDGCPTYAPAGPYRFALEVLAGGFDRLGVDEATVLDVGGPCP